MTFCTSAERHSDLIVVVSLIQTVEGRLLSANIEIATVTEANCPVVDIRANYANN